MQDAEGAKRAVGFAAVDRYVAPHTCIGLGSGTTAFWAIERVGERVRAGEELVAVATSSVTERLCRERGIPLVPFGEREIAVAIDGADEVAADWSLTKGGGGALFREKAVALAAATFVVIVTREKLVTRLGAFPTPVEVVPFSEHWIRRAIRSTLRRYGAEARPRTSPTTATCCWTARSARSTTRRRWTRSCVRCTASSRPDSSPASPTWCSWKRAAASNRSRGPERR